MVQVIRFKEPKRLDAGVPDCSKAEELRTVDF